MIGSFILYFDNVYILWTNIVAYTSRLLEIDFFSAEQLIKQI